MSQKRKSLKIPRNQAFLRQNGRCYYCQHPIWQENPEQFAQQYGLTLRQTKQMQCTGEHLTAHKDGGPDNASNIVAACRYCNMLRHKRKKEFTPEKYKILVSKRIKKNRWHGLSMQ